VRWGGERSTCPTGRVQSTGAGDRAKAGAEAPGSVAMAKQAATL
jgi:hypothetical protein